MAKSRIEWCDAVWNPTTGCTPVSSGCAHCYAARMARRLQAMGQPRYVHGFAPMIHPDALDIPLRWRRPRWVFVSSMGDLFHEDIPDGFIDAVFVVMGLARQHTFLILTKRARQMRKYCSSNETLGRWVALTARFLNTVKEIRIRLHCDGLTGIRLDNVWLGVSVENSDYLWRIQHLVQAPAALRFVSLEPLLGPIDLSPWLRPGGVSWVIAGGESGPKARPSEPDWFRSLRDQCAAAHVPFFLKQITEQGRKIPFNQWPSDLQVREVPDAAR